MEKYLESEVTIIPLDASVLWIIFVLAILIYISSSWVLHHHWHYGLEELSLKNIKSLFHVGCIFCLVIIGIIALIVDIGI